MKLKKESFFWIRVFIGYMLAFSILVFMITIAFGLDGYLAGFVGWPVVLALFMLELDDETKDALKRWVSTKKGGDSCG